MSFPVPQTKKQVRAFLGMTGYYRKFLHNFATIAAPLTDLIRKNQLNQVEWTPSCAKVFDNFKKQLCSDPVLKSPDFCKAFVLQTDALNREVDAVLSQIGDDNKEHPVAHFICNSFVRKL